MSNKIYTVPKGEIVQWINSLLPNDRVSKVEQLSSGHHYLILLDALWPGSFSFTKAHYNAITEYEKEQNFKIVQQALTKHNIDQYCDPGKLSQGRMQDNLEFAQWFKYFFDTQFDYTQNIIDSQRTKQKFGKKMSNTVVEDLSSTNAHQKLQEQKQKQKQIEQEAIKNAQLKALQQQQKYIQDEQDKIRAQQEHEKMQQKILNDEQRRISEQKQQELENIKSKQQQQIEQLQQLAEKRRKESQFYFCKLREIEIYCGKLRDQLQITPDEKLTDIVDKIEEILFAEYKE